MSAGWIWLSIGGGLMLAEFVVPGFVIVFFGLGAAALGALMLLLPEGWQLSLTWQISLFTFFSVLGLVTLRRYAKGVFMGDMGGDGQADPEFAGRLAQVTEAIEPGLPGRVMLGDAEWSASADESIAVGEKVDVLSRRNITLQVRKHI